MKQADATGHYPGAEGAKLTNIIDIEIPQIARELHLTGEQVAATVGLLDDGATVPFIARYRKEHTGSLDEVAITSIRDRLSQLRELRDRREIILASLEKRGLLSQELRKAVLAAQSMAVLEDTYLPHRPRRRTRAAVARERGLEPLALRLWGQGDFDVATAADEYVNPQAGVDNVKEALSGARDIIAEWVSEDSTARRAIRELFWSQGAISAAGPRPPVPVLLGPPRSGFIHQFGQFQHLFGGDDGAQPNLDSHALSSGADMADPASPARVWVPMLAAAMNRIPGQRVPELPGERP